LNHFFPLVRVSLRSFSICKARHVC
jgi:hypothetical protein